MLDHTAPQILSDAIGVLGRGSAAPGALPGTGGLLVGPLRDGVVATQCGVQRLADPSD